MTAGNPRAAARRGARGALGQARQPRRPGGTHAARARRGAALAAARAADRRRRSAPPRPNPARGARVLQRPGRLRRAGPRISRDRRQTASRTPAPWVNVMANRGFGFQVSGRRRRLHLGAQLRENALTPVVERSGHRPAGRDYLPARRGDRRTVDAHALAHPATNKAHYRCTHGPGYRRFDQRSHGLVARPGDVRAASTTRSRSAGSRVHNDSPRRRSLSVTGIRGMGAGPVARRGRAARAHRNATRSPSAVFARNPWNTAFPGVAFADLSRRCRPSGPAIAREFLGRHGALDAPAALVTGGALSGRTGRGARCLRRAAHAHRDGSRRHQRDRVHC